MNRKGVNKIPEAFLWQEPVLLLWWHQSFTLILVFLTEQV